jgi:enamine deaminase RidA (YjgF/YER057c/UK114 family)
MRSRCGLHLDYCTLAERPAWWSDVLGIATFGVAPVADEAPAAQVHTPRLAGQAVCEIFRGGEIVQGGRRGQLRYRATREVLLGCVTIPENERSAETRDWTALQQATFEAYTEMLSACDSAGYPYLVRVWNYLAQINNETCGIERYRQFNTARQVAFAGGGRAVTGRVPAACALGTPSGTPLVLYFLASRNAPAYVENPRQVSAYHYPPEYGVRSPVFSRAAVLHGDAGPTLFISGTASIVGHRTMHAGDVAAQTRETLTNIEAVIAEANRHTRRAPFTLSGLAFKVYVRHPPDLPVIQRELSAALDPQTRVIYLQADICREDLLVEIEAAGLSSNCLGAEAAHEPGGARQVLQNAWPPSATRATASS